VTSKDWPQAYIAGAPKCGTTALAQYLSEHPLVSVSAPKEPGYFATDLPGLSVVRDDGAYLRLFRKRGARVRIDASIWYLFSREAVANILARRPDARFIVMLRNPVTMIRSLHGQLLRTLDEDERDLAQAWRWSEARREGRNLPSKCRAPRTLVYTETAAFGEQLERLFEAVGPQRVLVLFQEELERDAAAVYRRVLAFLGLPDDGRETFSVINPAAGFRSETVQVLIKRDVPALQMLARPIKKALKVESLGFRFVLDNFNRQVAERMELPAQLAAEIGYHYRADMHRLSALLGRDLKAEFGWPL
jgi:Sulfotransferase family